MVAINTYPRDIQDILDNHHKWLKAHKKRGVQANFNYKNLSFLAFQNENIAKGLFLHSYIAECDFSGANLCGANFSHAIAIKTNFKGADLTNCNFHMADISSAVFDIDLPQMTSKEISDFKNWAKKHPKKLINVPSKCHFAVSLIDWYGKRLPKHKLPEKLICKILLGSIADEFTTLHQSGLESWLNLN